MSRWAHCTEHHEVRKKLEKIFDVLREQGITIDHEDGFIVIRTVDGFNGRLLDQEDSVDSNGQHNVTLPPEVEFKLCFKKHEDTDACICPDSCNCEFPDTEPACCSNECPVHNARPSVTPGCQAVTHRNGAVT
jgi:hypothetical protein